MAKEKAETKQYPLRIPPELFDKIDYVAKYNARSTNKEIELIIRRHVQRYEKEHGPIEIEKDS